MQVPPSRPRVRSAMAALAVTLTGGVLTAAPSPAAANPSSTAPSSTSAGSPIDLDALFIGAHPDDEAGTLSTFGQWGESHGVRTGVVTITRGEGGGNAVGPEEGPALGLLREDEERRAVGKAGISEVFNLDKVDFFYTVSAPLTEELWDQRDTLEKVVRLVRQTRPEILVTMDPAPSPGNHGNHQEAGRLALAAYYAAADPAAFPEQISKEKLTPFAPAKVLLNRARGTGPTGPSCVNTFSPTDPSQDIYGVYSGAMSTKQARTWAAIERDAQREYASQGWAGFPDVPSDPAQLGCDRFTLVDSRVPYPQPGTPAAAASTAILDGALTRAKGTVPLGTQLQVDSPFDVRPGLPTAVTVRVSAPKAHNLGQSSVALRVPDGWRVAGSGTLGQVAAGSSATARFTVTPAPDANLSTRARIGAFLTTRAGNGYTAAQVEVAPDVRTQQRLLPQVSSFEDWAAELGAAQLRGFVVPVLTIPSGGSRSIDYTVTNLSSEAQSGTVKLALPAGFGADVASRSFSDLAPGATTTVAFPVTNTDASLPTSNAGGTPGAAAGDYAYTVTTTTTSGSVSVTRPALELVPTTTISAVAQAPTLDGVVSANEYPGGALDISRRWEGSDCESAADCSGTARLARHGDTLYVAVEVRDDTAGTPLATADCKRHWRTDSVEIALDPRGRSENTSTTFKLAVLPFTAEGPACALRDADNHQGPIEQTAPGVRWASSLREPFTGYTVEVAIPLSELPDTVDPDRLGVNVLVYDSDTQDKTGQTRIGWSTWGGVQGDPYRWGQARLDGYQPPPGGPADEPVIPNTALRSVESPQTIDQAVRIHVPLSGGTPASANRSGWLTSARGISGGVKVELRATGPGEAHLFVVDEAGTPGKIVVPVTRAGRVTVTVPLERALGADPRVLSGWAAPDGAGTLASKIAVN
ncbi:sugar-binding protein [Actinopolymorpha alba]|uniref:sugar-binding protein n=1 Tax=Actinopolymorpha alba TaxID=533267 RepID=UPI0007C6BF8D|nr:sugar-binding protein [Actinopolymorpha alba]